MMKKKQIKVVYAKRGLASFFGDYIELNYHLKNNKKLRDYIVKHELNHSKSFDLGHEFKSINFKIMPSLIYFVLKHPSTWIDFLPIYIRNKTFIYDINLTILYCMSSVLLIILIYIISKIFL